MRPFFESLKHASVDRPNCEKHFFSDDEAFFDSELVKLTERVASVCPSKMGRLYLAGIGPTIKWLVCASPCRTETDEISLSLARVTRCNG